MAIEHKNEVILRGNLGADPELRMTQGGKAVLKLRLATTEHFEVNGEKKEKTEWHRIVLWGEQAERLGKELSKGDMVFVFGQNRTTSYENKDKQKVWTTEVNASVVTRIGGGKKQGSGSQGGGAGYAPRGGSKNEPFNADDHPDGAAWARGERQASDADELPF
jgi:single-strand DNA-binding protein